MGDDPSPRGSPAQSHFAAHPATFPILPRPTVNRGVLGAQGADGLRTKAATRPRSCPPSPTDSTNFAWNRKRRGGVSTNVLDTLGDVSFPDWDHCANGADGTADPAGCRGVKVPGFSACLAHLDEADRASYLGGLRPGDAVDHRGTPFHTVLLRDLLDALREHAGSPTRIGVASFQEATFHGSAIFSETEFTGAANFDRAEFDVAEFSSASFAERASFDESLFNEYAYFNECIFVRGASFLEAVFRKPAFFDAVGFLEFAFFSAVTFNDLAFFGEVLSSGDFDLSRATFTAAAPRLGPLLCGGTLILDYASFAMPVTIEAGAERITCERTRWDSTATLRLRHATLDLADAVLTQPVSVIAHPVPFSRSDRLNESGVRWSQAGLSVESLRGVDCAMLTMSDVDLTSCRFSGALHLDQLRLDGHWAFAGTPQGRRWHRGLPFRWTRRQVIEEERQWRALPGRPAGLCRGWGIPCENEHDVPGLATLTIIYRQLRKSREDAKDEPGAADFYYGEMEMRRHSFGWRRAERWLLSAYWLLSGYGLRASRALGWLIIAMLVTVVLMMGFGLPQNSPKQEATGTAPTSGGRVTFEIDKEDPKNPVRDRFTSKRFEKALKVTLNSVVFRSSEGDLTTSGEYIEMVSRFSEPILLGLAALAIRGRVKR